MILDAIGTEFRAGRLWLASDRNRALQWWMPQGDRTTYVARVYSRRTAQLLWQRPFASFVDALSFKARFQLGERSDCPSFDAETDCIIYNACEFLSPGNHVWYCPDGLSTIREIADRSERILEATTGSWTATNSTNSDWFTGNKVPANVSATDYLVIAGGGGGGCNMGGGGGAGGYRTSTAFAVTAGTQVTVTVGAAGAAGTSGVDATAGGNSVFSSITSDGGGRAGGGAGGTAAGGNGGSGGGGYGGGGSAAGGTATSGQGSSGGTSTGGGGAAGGGGAGGAGAANPSTTLGGAGGAGTASSILGSSVTRASGGSGGSQSSSQSATTGGGGAGGGATIAGGAGTANTGGGGGGGGSSSANGGAGGTGLVALSYTASAAGVTTNLAMMGM